MSIHGVLKKEKDSCSICTPIQILLVYSLVSTAKHAIAKISFFSYCRQVCLVLEKKKNNFDVRKKEGLLVFKAYWWKLFFCLVAKGIILNRGSIKFAVWEMGGEGQVKGKRDLFSALILCGRRSPFTVTLVFSTAAFSTFTGSWLNLSALIPRYAKCRVYPSVCEAAQGLFLSSI